MTAGGRFLIFSSAPPGATRAVYQDQRLCVYRHIRRFLLAHMALKLALLPENARRS